MPGQCFLATLVILDPCLRVAGVILIQWTGEKKITAMNGYDIVAKSKP